MDAMLRDRLVQADEGWKNTEIPEGSGSSIIPDGEYKAMIVGLEIKESRNQNLILAWDLQITSEGSVFGRHTFINNTLQGEYSWIAKKNLKTVGIEEEHLYDLPERFVEALERSVEIQLKTKDNKQNVYINDLVEEDGI